jgi:AraC-like DNA-binding protein
MPDLTLCMASVAAHRAFETGAPLLERQSKMRDAFSHPLSRLETLDALPARFEGPAIKWAKEYLEECFADDIGIDELAEVAGLSASYLVRSFRHQIGVCVHAYLTRIRLRPRTRPANPR